MRVAVGLLLLAEHRRVLPRLPAPDEVRLALVPQEQRRAHLPGLVRAEPEPLLDPRQGVLQPGQPLLLVGAGLVQRLLAADPGERAGDLLHELRAGCGGGGGHPRVPTLERGEELLPQGVELPLGGDPPRDDRGSRRGLGAGLEHREPVAQPAVLALEHLDPGLERGVRGGPGRQHRDGLRRRGRAGLDELVTDRSDASGTGWFDGVDYRPELLERFFGSTPALPRLLGPAESVDGPGGIRVGAGAGDNAAAGLGVDAGDDVVVSLGTSGTVFARSERRAQDPSGIVAGFSDATGAYLPLVCTLNASRVLDATRRLLGVDHDELGRLALAAEPGAGGLVVVPYLEGERTPNLPDATGALHGWTLASGTRENLARAAVEGMLSAQRVGLEALREQGVTVSGVTLVGGAARSEAVCRIAAQVFEVPVRVPEPGEYVADGAARQAAWALHGGATPPSWSAGAEPARYEADPAPAAWERYREAAGAFLDRVAG